MLGSSKAQRVQEDGRSDEPTVFHNHIKFLAYDQRRRRAKQAMSQGINMNTDGLLLWEPDGDLAALEIWIGTPTGAEMIGAGMFGYWIAPING